MKINNCSFSDNIKHSTGNVVMRKFNHFGTICSGIQVVKYGLSTIADWCGGYEKYNYIVLRDDDMFLESNIVNIGEWVIKAGDDIYKETNEMIEKEYKDIL